MAGVITAHPIDTGAASQWALAGRPVGVLYAGRHVSAFVQRSGMRGRPWLRFSSKLTPSPFDGWWVTAHKTRDAALDGACVKCGRTAPCAHGKH